MKFVVALVFFSMGVLAHAAPSKDVSIWLEDPLIEVSGERNSQQSDDRVRNVNELTVTTGCCLNLGIDVHDTWRWDITSQSLTLSYWTMPHALAVGGYLHINNKKTSEDHLLSSSSNEDENTSIVVGPSVFYRTEINEDLDFEAGGRITYNRFKDYGKTVDDNGNTTSEYTNTYKDSIGLFGKATLVTKVTRNFHILNGVTGYRRSESYTNKSERTGVEHSVDAVMYNYSLVLLGIRVYLN